MLKRCILEKIIDFSEYMKKNHCDDYTSDESGYVHNSNKLPFGVLYTAVKSARTGGEVEKVTGEKVFSKYQEIYESLKNMEQLYIAT